MGSNQLTGIASTGFAASFTYDSFGRRTGKTIQGVTTNFVYDGLNPVQEKAGATVTANLLTGLGIDEFFTRTDGVGTRVLLPDVLGSTVSLGDGTGTLQTQYTYEPFGSATQMGLASLSSYKYTGREDDGTGLSYYRARYYSPVLGRFISEDPIGFLGGDGNLYGYVRNNPINLIDPTGLDPCCNQTYGECVRKCMEDRLGNLVDYAWKLYGLGAAFGIGSTPASISAGPYSVTSNLATVSGGRLGRAIGTALGGASAGRVGLSIGVRVGAGTLAGIGLGASHELKGSGVFSCRDYGVPSACPLSDVRSTHC